MLKKIFVIAAIITGLFVVFIVVNSCEDLAFRDDLEDSVKKWYEQAKLTAGEEAETDSKYGTAVAISGDFAVVGAYGKNVGAFTDAGAVYIYKRNEKSWDLLQTPLTGVVANEYFGFDVDISGNFIIIGAAGTDPAAYIYEYTGTTFVRIKKLTSNRDPLNYDVAFGAAVAIDGDWAVVGDYFYDWEPNGSNEGAAFVYSKNTGWAEQKLRLQNQGVGFEFGFSVDISGNNLVVGAKHNNSNGLNAGAIYIYTNSNNVWGDGINQFENKMITLPNGQPGDNFGYSVSIYQENLIVGAIGNGGFITIYKKNANDWIAYNQLRLSRNYNLVEIAEILKISYF